LGAHISVPIGNLFRCWRCQVCDVILRIGVGLINAIQYCVLVIDSQSWRWTGRFAATGGRFSQRNEENQTR